MARPIKMHEDTLFRVMQKSLKPLEASMSKVSIALQTQSVESKIEGKRAEKITQDNEIKQTNLLNDIATSFKYERKILQAGFKGMKSIAAMPMKVGGFIKDHWGKLGLVGIGTALATMDAKDWMNLINSLRDGLKTVKEKWPDWQKNIQSEEWWGKQADKLKTFGEKMGGYIMDGIKIWLTGKAVLGLGAAFAKYLAPAIVTAIVSKKVLKDAIKNSGLVPSKTGDAATKKPVDTKKPPATGTFKEKVKNAAARTKEIAKKGAGRWMPILGRAGALLGWVAAPLLVVPSIKESLDESVKKLKEQKEAPKVWDWNNNFFTVLMDSSTRLAETLSLGALEKSKMDKAAKDTTEKLSKSIIRIFSKVNFHFNRTTEQMSHDFDKWKTKKKGEWDAYLEKRAFIRGQNEMGGSQQSDAARSSIAGLTTEEKRAKARDKGRTVTKRSVNQAAIDQAARQKAAAGDTGEPGLWDKTKSFFSGTTENMTVPTTGTKSKTMPPSWNKRSKDIVSGLDSSFGSKVKEFVSQMWNDKGIDAVIYSGGRGQEEQTAAFKKGAGAPYPHSLHNYGGAIDFFMQSGPGVNGIWNKNNPWGLAGSIAKGLGMRWGGDFENFYDAGHLQVAKNWKQAAKTMPQLASGGIIKGGQGGVLAWIGEGNQDEMVMPLPGNSPHQRMAMMNSMYNERAMSTSGGSSPVNLITSSNSTSSSNNTVPVFTPQVRGKQYV